MNSKEDVSLRKYIASLLKKNLREGGRKPFEYRNIKIETDVLSQANGSARVKFGDAEVFVGVKVGLGSPFPDTPNDGVLMVNGELSPLASEDFETGPPSPRSIEVSRVIDRAIRESGTIDTSKLCIEPGEKVWMVFVDVYPLNEDGNLFDAGLLGAIAALKTARMPAFDKKTGKVDYRTLTKEKVPLSEEPVMCTFWKLDGEIFVDATRRENKVADCRLSIGLNKKGNVCAMQKGGEGTFTDTEVFELVKKAQSLSKDLRKHF
ncbi:exosome complex protein Rrp42 [Candidatus Woesearchaeota archaeon]|jgi:exosome complex component RRP42|nr:exosome complex protein Rrp42 [Candidatus Woesearchaeota archaeon]MBT4114448.1 exosome complex protein Rrp42 [Candidatus Woesearchaeota archaeon]MBT4248232.1 exosome complex protein Rrp42 [Candidatus Woesearchaeota archaeon]